jgi:hypothetical protein
VDPKAAVVNVKTTAAEEQAVYDFPSSIVKIPNESNVRAAVDAAVLVGMAMGAALLLQETKKEAKRRRSAPRRAMPALVPIQMLVSIHGPVPVLNSVPVFLPAPVERTALDVAVPTPLAAEAAPVLPLAPALVPVLVPVSSLLRSPVEELPSSLYDEATDVHEEGSLVEAAPASEPMSLLQAAPDEAASGPDPPPAPDEATDVFAAEAAQGPASRAGLDESFYRLSGEATDVPAAEAAPAPAPWEELPSSLIDEATDVPAAPDEAAPVPAPLLASDEATDVPVPVRPRSREEWLELYRLYDEATDVPREGSLLEATPVPAPVLRDSSPAGVAPGPAPDVSSHKEAVPVPAPPLAPRGSPVVEPPSWPTFNDSHEEFFKFKNNLSSFLNDFCADLSEVSKVRLIKENCLSLKTVKEVEHFTTVKEILDWLHERYFFPPLIVEKLILSLGEKFGVKPVDGNVVAEVLELYEYLYRIFYQIREQRLWYAFSPDPGTVLRIIKFLPRGERSSGLILKFCPERLKMSRLESFVQERLTFFREFRWIEDFKEMTCPTNHSPNVSKNVFRCSVPGCNVDSRHKLDSCVVYLKLSVSRRLQFLNTERWCTVCLRHKQGKMCFASRKRLPCGVGGCKEQHHTSLHVDITNVLDFSFLGANRTEDAVVREDTANALINPLVFVPRVVAEVDPENQEVEVTSEVSNNNAVSFLSPKGIESLGRPVEVQCSLEEAGVKECVNDSIFCSGPMGTESLGNLVEAVSSPHEVNLLLGPGEAAEPETGPGEAGESLGVNVFILGLEVSETRRVPEEAEDSQCKNVFCVRPNETEVGGDPVEANQSPGWDGNMFMLLVFFVHVWTKKFLFLVGDFRMLFGQVLQLFLFSMFFPSPIGGPAAEHCHGGGYPCVVL